MSNYSIYDAIEIVGGAVGGVSTLIGIVIVFAMGLLNGKSLLQITSGDSSTLMIIGTCGIGFTVIIIMISKFMQMIGILNKYNAGVGDKS